MSLARVTVVSEGKTTVLVEEEDIVLGALIPTANADVQSVGYFRGAKKVFFDRGNVEYALNFTVEKTWETLEEARAWSFDARAKIPRSGNVSFRLDGYTGKSVRRWMIDAVIRVSMLPNSGVTSRTQFQILSGEIVSTPPVA